MNTEIDFTNWSTIARNLKQKYPQLTDADLIWRHETKTDFYKIIAAGLGISRVELEQIIEQMQPPAF